MPTCFNDELLPGLNYNATDSGIFFDKFPNDKPRKRGGFTIQHTSSVGHYPWQ